MRRPVAIAVWSPMLLAMGAVPATAATIGPVPGAIRGGGLALAAVLLGLGLAWFGRRRRELESLASVCEAFARLNAVDGAAPLRDAALREAVALVPGVGGGLLLLEDPSGGPMAWGGGVGVDAPGDGEPLPARAAAAAWYRRDGVELAAGVWQADVSDHAPALLQRAAAAPVLVLELEAGGRPLGLLVLTALAGGKRFPGLETGALGVVREAASAASARAAVLERAAAEGERADATAERLRETLRRLEEAGRSDGLTGLASRRDGLDRLTAEWRRADRHRRPCVVLLAGIDAFADLARRGGGPDAGDTALVEVARLIRRTLREHDVAARWDADSFLLVLPETTAEGGRQAGERLLAAVNAADIRERAGWLDPTLTVAVAELASLRTPAEAVELARRALERGRTEGGNRVVVAEGSRASDAAASAG